MFGLTGVGCRQFLLNMIRHRGFIQVFLYTADYMLPLTRMVAIRLWCLPAFETQIHYNFASVCFKMRQNQCPPVVWKHQTGLEQPCWVCRMLPREEAARTRFRQSKTWRRSGETIKSRFLATTFLIPTPLRGGLTQAAMQEERWRRRKMEEERHRLWARVCWLS